MFAQTGAPNPTVFRIDGASGVDVAPFSAFGGEAEILFPPGMLFDVKSNVVDAAGVRQVTLIEAAR
jgi:hypothetical protein